VFPDGQMETISTVQQIMEDNSRHQVAEGVDIYLGVIPAEMILGHPKLHTEAEMHGGVPVGEHRYHVTVALFDAATGKRITGAQVKASVSELGLSGIEKSWSQCSSPT